MFIVLSDIEKLATAQNRLRDQLIKAADDQIPFKAGFQGGAIQQDAYWFKRENFWGFWLGHYTAMNGRQRYWNAFGVGRPEPRKGGNITVEVNSPLDGVDRRIGGAFVMDDAGATFLAHRGKIGGGKPGVYTKQFQTNFQDQWMDIEDGGRINRFVIVGRIGADDFIFHLGKFVHAVARIKVKI